MSGLTSIFKVLLKSFEGDGGDVQNLELGNQNHTVYRPAGIVYVVF